MKYRCRKLVQIFIHAILSCLVLGCASHKEKQTSGVWGTLLNDENYHEKPHQLERPAVNPAQHKQHFIKNQKRMVLTHPPSVYQHWLGYFSQKDKPRFTRFLKNALSYEVHIRKIFEQYGLPGDLFYVGLIESGYYTHSRSHAAAVGPWQFLQGTAKQYGLRVDDQVDERRNVFKATHAAARYFKDLYNIFGHWELALCAYNAGEYRVINAIRRGNTRDYQKLRKLKLLPRETYRYISKVAAAREVSLRREKYGFHVRPRYDFTRLGVVNFQKSLDSHAFAKDHGMTIGRLKQYNPDLKVRWVRANKLHPFSLFYPGDQTPLEVAQSVKDKPVKDMRGAKLASRRRVSRGPYYRVRRGDTLGRIARRQGLSLSQLKRLNNLRSSRIYAGQKLRVQSDRSVSSSGTGAPLVASQALYRVRRGDYLGSIARRHGMGLSQLKRLNGLRSNRIFVGQKLKVRGAVKTYVVRRGDNLYRIAKRFGISVQELRKINDLNHHRIYPRQKLKIPDQG